MQRQRYLHTNTFIWQNLFLNFKVNVHCVFIRSNLFSNQFRVFSTHFLFPFQIIISFMSHTILLDTSIFVCLIVLQNIVLSVLELSIHFQKLLLKFMPSIGIELIDYIFIMKLFSVFFLYYFPSWHA